MKGSVLRPREPKPKAKEREATWKPQGEAELEERVRTRRARKRAGHIGKWHVEPQKWGDGLERTGGWVTPHGSVWSYPP